MISKDTLIEVVNRDNGSVGYTIPDLGNLHRNFQPREMKEIPMDELRKLSYLPGGQVILEDCLIIKNEEAIAELLGGVEPEYFYTEEDVKNLLLTGSLDQFKDCLDFAPQGVIDLVKSMAVDLKINDISKREAILAKTGFNVTKAIDINTASSEGEEKAEGKTRRANPMSGSEAARRVSAPKYKITSIKE